MLAISGWISVVVLHSFLIVASRPIYLNPDRDYGGLSFGGVDVSCIDWRLRLLYIGCYVVVLVDDCHKLCCREVYLVGGRAVVV